MIVLTPHQLEGVEFMKRSDKRLILNGNAGTGKTTVVAEFCNRLVNSKIILTAPTNKAVQVLRTKSVNSCKTIHAYLKLNRKLVGSEYKFVYDGDDIDEVDVLIIDEGSMLDTYLLNLIDELLPNTKIIFVGDDKQLNPVGESTSPVFTRDYPTFTLTEIVRHTNDIVDLSMNIDWLYSKIDGKAFRWLDPSEFPLDYLVESNGSDKAKFITWTNAVVDSVNKTVRSVIYDEPAQLEIGETILLKEAFAQFKNNDEILIKTIEHDWIEFTATEVKYPEIQTFRVNEDLIILDHTNKQKHSHNVDNLSKKAKYGIISWHVYYSYIERFASYQYNHAITVHKSQGSTYERSLVHISDIVRNPNVEERTRMLYTAVTRASQENLFI